MISPLSTRRKPLHPTRDHYVLTANDTPGDYYCCFQESLNSALRTPIGALACFRTCEARNFVKEMATPAVAPVLGGCVLEAPGSQSRCACDIGRSHLRSVLLGVTGGGIPVRVVRFLDNVAARCEQEVDIERA